MERADDDLQRNREAIGEAWNRAARARAEVEDRVPRPGDLFVFAETAEKGVLWALVEPSDSPDRCRLVATDGMAFTGSRDVAVPASAACGALRVRCGVFADLAREALESARPVGLLPAESLEQVHSKLAALQAGREVGSELERRTDDELDYQEWVEDTLGQAQSALLRKDQSLAAVPPPVASITPARTTAWGSRFRQPWLLAASILAALTLGLLGLAAGQQRRIAGLLGVVAEQQREIAELIAVPPGSRTHGNLPFVYLQAAGTRSEAKVLEVPPTASWMAVVLLLDDPDDFPEYRLEIREKDTARQVGAVGGLTRMGVAELSVALRREMLGNGEYRLLLYGRRDGEVTLVDEFALRIRVK